MVPEVGWGRVGPRRAHPIRIRRTILTFSATRSRRALRVSLFFLIRLRVAGNSREISLPSESDGVSTGSLGLDLWLWLHGVSVDIVVEVVEIFYQLIFVDEVKRMFAKTRKTRPH